MASCGDDNREEDHCSSCNTKTKYQCIRCSIALCNRCVIFDNNEEVDGWKALKSVGYCMECDLLYKNDEVDNDSSLVLERKRSSSDASAISAGSSAISSRGRSASSDTSNLQLDDCDEEWELERPKKKKKTGRKASWSDNVLEDFIDIIVNNANYKRKLIFTNTKNQQNGILYNEILRELKTRCSSRNEAISYTIPQLRNKFKKCVAECKRVAMTVKTATGIKRLQEDKGYGAWFDKLFPLIQSRDSCQPHLAVEPSSNSTTSDSLFEEESHQLECNETTECGVKQFVPTRKKKVDLKDQVGEAVELFKCIVQRDTTKDILNYMQEEAAKSRQHELELAKLVLNSTNADSTMAMDCNQQQGYSQPPNVDYQHYSYHYNQVPPQHFPPTTVAHPNMNQDVGVDNFRKRYHSL